jgi:hypothetical protein
LYPLTGSVHKPVNPSLIPKKNACAKLDREISRDETDVTFPPSFMPLLRPFRRPGFRTVDPYNAGVALKPSAIESIIYHIPKNNQVISIQAHKSDLLLGIAVVVLINPFVGSLGKLGSTNIN